MAREVIVEFIPQGNFMKVTAIDAITGREVTMVGDPNAGQPRLKELAIQKLEYVLSKEQ